MLMVQEFGNFPGAARGAVQEYSAVLVRFNFLLNVGWTVLAYCFVIKVLKDHHSLRLIVLRFTPWARSSLVLGGQVAKY